jgi:Protein kinase domain
MVEGLQDGDPLWAGPYRLHGRLGNGGMGQVFLGRSAGGRPVAVKVIRADLAGDVNFRARFRQEVAAARKVSGLFTALVVDADLDGKMPWLATAYVAGPSLAEAVTSHGTLPAGTVLALAAGLAEGLQVIHAAGVVHRDLKPSNVLLADDGPRVIDFGVSRAAEASVLTHTGAVVGSPGFMSPEQAEGGEVGPPSDMFSLGAVLTFAATGEGPFGAGSTAALIYRVVHGQPSLDHVPAEVRPLAERCLAKNPADRPTAGELLAELRGTTLTADWLPEQIVRDLPSYAVSDADPGGAADEEGSPGQDAGERAPARDVPEVPATVTAVAASPAPGGVTGPPRPGSATGGAAGGAAGSRPRRGRGRLALASGAVVLVAAAVAALSLVGRPAAGHPGLAAGSSPAASSSLAAAQAAASQAAASQAEAAQAAASREASASADRSPSAHASPSARTKTAGPTPQAGSGSAPGAAGVPAPAVLTSVSSAYAPDDGNVFVMYQDGADSSAQVSGQVTNAASGEVARLYAQQFPFTSPPALVNSAVLDPSGTSAAYTFTVTPTLATRYTVEVFRDSAAAAPLATSAASTVYVVINQPGNNTWKCSGTQCQSDETVTVIVPPSALSAQMSEKIYTYFAINYGTGTVPEPETLQLGAGDPTVSAAEQISSDEYQFSLIFSFSSDNEKWSDHYRHCTISIEAQDGIGLPGGGDYGCGSQTIPGTQTYIG